VIERDPIKNEKPWYFIVSFFEEGTRIMKSKSKLKLNTLTEDNSR
jgi:hypothetical protein